MSRIAVQHRMQAPATLNIISKPYIVDGTYMDSLPRSGVYSPVFVEYVTGGFDAMSEHTALMRHDAIKRWSRDGVTWYHRTKNFFWDRWDTSHIPDGAIVAYANDSTVPIKMFDLGSSRAVIAEYLNKYKCYRIMVLPEIPEMPDLQTLEG